jgi:glycosyltransferase involved in cell wall biosynthesis
MRVCVSSQTPFIRFNLSYNELLDKYGSLPDPLEITELEEGIDYNYSPGGVTAMVYPLICEMLNQKYLSKAVWVSLGVKYPPRVKVGDILVSHIEIPDHVLRDYTIFKENLWSQIHGLSSGNIFDRGYEGYARFNWANAEAQLEYWKETDIFYVQDFQLLLTGGIIGPPAPAVLRWHVPFAPEKLPHLTHRALVKCMESFDAVVVSTRRDLEGLIKSAYRGRAHQVYPFVNPNEWKDPPSESTVAETREKIGLKGDEKLLLMVARMDKIKSHDVAIKALSRLKNMGRFRLALIGNGSFSSTRKGGLGHGKGGIWKAELEKLVSELGLEDSVSFMGHTSKEELKAAYSLSSAVLLTSGLEGFGITVLEAWLNKKPVVVSKGAGVSELVVDDSNGYTFSVGDDNEAARAILKALGARGDKLGENGFETSKQCHINATVEREKAIFEEAVSIYA